MQTENSWIERLDFTGDTIELDDINTHMDLFYVVRGAVVFTMREDVIQRALKADDNSQYSKSLETESVLSYSSKQDFQPIIRRKTIGKMGKKN